MFWQLRRLAVGFCVGSKKRAQRVVEFFFHVAESGTCESYACFRIFLSRMRNT